MVLFAFGKCDECGIGQGFEIVAESRLSLDLTFGEEETQLLCIATGSSRDLYHKAM